MFPTQLSGCRLQSRSGGDCCLLFGACGSFAAEVGYYEADFVVGDFGWEGFFQGLQPFEAAFGAGGFDYGAAGGVDPFGVEFDGAGFDQIGYGVDDRRELASANLCDVFEAVASCEQAERLDGWGRFFLWRWGCAGSVAEAGQGVENLLTEGFGFAVSDAGYLF